MPQYILDEKKNNQMKRWRYYNQSVSDSGFTLIEILIVILVFSIGMLGLSALQFSATQGNRGAYTLTEATVAASSQLEKLLSANYSDPILTPGNYTITTNTYSISYRITEPVSNQIKNIALSITRTDDVVRTNRYNLIVTNIQ